MMVLVYKCSVLELTEQAVAETVPHACRRAPGPAALDARSKGEVYSDERNQ